MHFLLYARRGLLLSAGVWLAGCMQSDPQQAFDTGVRDPLGAHGTLRRVVWRRGGPEEAAADEAVRRLLQRPLTAERAVQVALLGNRTLQTDFAEVGISYGDYVTAGMLKNPDFSGSVRLPDRPPGAVDVELAVAQDFLDALLLPLRKRLAAAQLHAVELRVADRTLQLAADVQRAFYTYQARHQLIGRLELIADTNRAAADFTRSLHAAGNVNDLDLVNQQAVFTQSRIDVQQARAQLATDREMVTRLLGLDGIQAANWIAAAELPPIPRRAETSVAVLEDRAVKNRFDLEADRALVTATEQALALRVGTRYFPAGVRVGVDTEQQSDHQKITGPTLDLELPIFNQGQGEIAKLKAKVLQARAQLQAAAVNIRSDVREARARVGANRDLAVELRDTVLPQRQQALKLTLQQYNGMLKGAYDLLLTKANEVAAERSYIEAWRDYWIARADLARAAGER